MDQRRLGQTGLMVPRLCLGGNVFGWTADQAASFEVLDGLLDAGLNFIDTADVYSAWVPGHTGGESESIFGRWMAARRNRDRIVVATKVGWDRGLSAAHIRSAPWMPRSGGCAPTVSICTSRTRTTPTRRSKRRSVPMPTSSGPARSGRSALRTTAPRGSGRRSGSAHATGLPRYESLQPEYNLYNRAGFEADLEPLCCEEGLGVICYYALASGFLTGKYRSEADFAKSARGERMGKYLNDRGRRILAALDAVAARHRATAAQVALAWLMARPGGDGSDRERDLARSARGSRGGHALAARCGFGRAADGGELLRRSLRSVGLTRTGMKRVPHQG